MIDFVLLLGPRFEFFGDIIFPGIVGAIVLVWIANSILKHWGYCLW